MPDPVDPSVPLHAALEDAWRAVQRHHPDLPDATLEVAAGGADRWTVVAGRVTLAIGRDALAAGGPHVLDRLLRGAARALAARREIRVTSRAGPYYNRRFRAIGEEVGLIFGAPSTTNGWTASGAGAAAREHYSQEVNAIDEARRGAPPARPPRAGQRGAACRCPRRIHIAPTVLDRGAVVCAVCGHPFTFVDSPTRTPRSERENTGEAASI